MLLVHTAAMTAYAPTSAQSVDMVNTTAQAAARAAPRNDLLPAV
jgi:hypothetical protein